MTITGTLQKENSYRYDNELTCADDRSTSRISKEKAYTVMACLLNKMEWDLNKMNLNLSSLTVKTEAIREQTDRANNDIRRMTVKIIEIRALAQEFNLQQDEREERNESRFLLIRKVCAFIGAFFRCLGSMASYSQVRSGT
jgi:hypothetical protein